MNDNWINLSELTWCNINHVCVYVCLFFLFVLCKLCRWVVPPGELFFWLTPWPLTFDGSKVKTCFNVQFHVLLRTKIKMAESLFNLTTKKMEDGDRHLRWIGNSTKWQPWAPGVKTPRGRNLAKSKHGRGFFFNYYNNFVLSQCSLQLS